MPEQSPQHETENVYVIDRIAKPQFIFREFLNKFSRPVSEESISRSKKVLTHFIQNKIIDARDGHQQLRKKVHIEEFGLTRLSFYEGTKLLALLKISVVESSVIPDVKELVVYLDTSKITASMPKGSTAFLLIPNGVFASENNQTNPEFPAISLEDLTSTINDQNLLVRRSLVVVDEVNDRKLGVVRPIRYEDSEVVYSFDPNPLVQAATNAIFKREDEGLIIKKLSELIMNFGTLIIYTDQPGKTQKSPTTKRSNFVKATAAT